MFVFVTVCENLFCFKSVNGCSPKENSKLMGLSPIFRSIMVASKIALNSMNLSQSSSVGCTHKLCFIAFYKHDFN